MSFVCGASHRRPVQIPRGDKKNQYTNVLAACTLLDIPTGWDPRTNQSPTGALITSPTARPVLLQIPRGDKKNQYTNVLAACTLLDIPTGWDPRAKQSHTMALFAVLRTVALFKSRAETKRTSTRMCTGSFGASSDTELFKTIVVQFVLRSSDSNLFVLHPDGQPCLKYSCLLYTTQPKNYQNTRSVHFSHHREQMNAAFCLQRKEASVKWQYFG